MKRLIMMLLLVALAIPATAFAAISGSEGTTIADGKATLVSNDETAYSYISFDDLNGQQLTALDALSADVVSGTNWGGGSPRFHVKVSNGSDFKNIFVYLGELPNLNTYTPGSTGNLLDTGARVDSTKVGGPYYGTWQDAKTAAATTGYTTISSISLMVDSGWSGPQTFVFDAVSINGTMHSFGPVGPVGPVCQTTGFNGLTAAQIGGNVTGPLDATGCDIGVYYGPSASGDVTTADISGAKHYGVVVNGASTVDVTGSKIHQIGNSPFDGSQNGRAVFYTAGATGTVSGNKIYDYQKNGFVATGDKTAVQVLNNEVTGRGHLSTIAQNGVVILDKATALVKGNSISGNWYTPTTYTSYGLLLIDANGVKQQANSFLDNESNLGNFGRGGGNHNA